jgi:hypothetical protein
MIEAFARPCQANPDNEQQEAATSNKNKQKREAQSRLAK